MLAGSVPGEGPLSGSLKGLLTLSSHGRRDEGAL